MDAADVPALRESMLDTSRSLFERYRALFSLRNLNTRESTLALVDGLRDESALFRHEIGVFAGLLTLKKLKKLT
jgi:deoxyhypusine monooxygenase